MTFGYFIPSEEYMRSLLARLDSSNPNIRLDFQIYADLTLSSDLTLRDNVSLHTDMNWNQGGSFTIPAGVTLTIPQGSGFYAHSSAINIGGSLVNNGAVVLSSVGNVENYPHILPMTLQSGGSITVGDWASFSLNINGWNESVANNTTVSGNGYFSLDIYANNEAAYLNGVEAVKNFNPYNASFRSGMRRSPAIPLKTVPMPESRLPSAVRYRRLQTQPESPLSRSTEEQF